MSLEQLHQFLISSGPKTRTRLGKFGVESLKGFCEEQHLVVQATGRRGRVKADYVKAVHAWSVNSHPRASGTDGEAGESAEHDQVRADHTMSDQTEVEDMGQQPGQKRKAGEWMDQTSEPVKVKKRKTAGVQSAVQTKLTDVQTASRRIKKNKIYRIIDQEVQERPTCKKRNADECIEDFGEDRTEDGMNKSSTEGTKRRSAVQGKKQSAVVGSKINRGDSIGRKGKKDHTQVDKRSSAGKKSKRDHSWHQIIVRAFVTRDNPEALKEVTASLGVDGSLNLNDLATKFNLSGELRFVFPRNRYTYKPSSASKLSPEEIRELTDLDGRLGVTFNRCYMSRL